MLGDNPSLLVKLSGGDVSRVSVRGSGTYSLGPIEVAIEVAEDRVSWMAAATSDAAVDKISLVWEERAGGAGRGARVFSNGYQSWSRSGTVVLGRDRDPSEDPSSIELVRGIYHADAGISPGLEARSELVTVIDGGADLLCLGFEGGSEHDGTIRVRQLERGIEVEAEAFLGGAVIRGGNVFVLHSFGRWIGSSCSELLESWASRFGEEALARVRGPYQIGWCSWYRYFHGVDEKAVRDNLALASAWPFDVFQIDDGYQPAVGDWLTTNEKFPSGLEALAGAVASEGLQPGIWLAPFLAAPSSELFSKRPELAARYEGGTAPLIATVNAGWGGQVYALDTSRPETLERIERVATELVASGFTFLKLDFMFAGSSAGLYADPGMTPAQRVRAGLEAVRRGAGEEAFLLGCGCPLGPAAGVVDGMRIGPDVAPFWGPEGNSFIPPGYDLEVPSTRNAWRNTLARSFMHRRLWLNDPDCLMLRTTETELTEEQRRLWSYAVAVSGGMAIVSDDLALLDSEAQSFLNEVMEMGRSSDEAARTTHPARCQDLMQSRTPGMISSPSASLRGEPEEGKVIELNRTQ